MCTVILSIGSSPDWPLLLAANRDEKLDRPALPPACHWPDQPDVLGGLDVLAGGTWLALNRAGVVAAVLNRTGTLGPAPGKRSRGVLPLLALRHATAQSAIESFAALDGGDWRSFNLIVADCNNSFFVRGTGEGRLQTSTLAPGVHMVTAQDPDDLSSPRIARNLPLFAQAPAPSPPDWSEWPALLADSTPPQEAALNILPVAGFGTVSSALIGLSTTEPPVFCATCTAPHARSFRSFDWGHYA